jgi:FkbM family methyltransferase
MKRFLLTLLIAASGLSAEPIRTTWCNTAQMMQLAKAYVPSNPIIIEAGAYEGAETIRMAYLWPQGTIYAFEPVPEAYEHLRQRAQGVPSIHTYPVALGNKTGTSTIYLARNTHQPDRICGSSSLLPPKEHLTYDQDISFPEKAKVAITTLDQWAKDHYVDHIDLLWLDMQGTELTLLKSSDIAKTAKAIYIELEFVEAYKGQQLYPEVRAYLEKQGYTMVAADFAEEAAQEALHRKPDLNAQRHGQLYFGNALFVKTPMPVPPIR